VVDAVRATADTLNASLEQKQMKVVEEMRRTLREIKDVNKLASNWTTMGCPNDEMAIAADALGAIEDGSQG
jgi:hypothetical protein